MREQRAIEGKMRADGNVVLIPGGSGALGQTVVPSFVAAGARVITVDQHPPSVHVEGRTDMKADVTDEADVRRLVDEVIRRAGRIDTLINLVGGFATGPVVETDDSLWHRMLTMNLTAAFLLSRRCCLTCWNGGRDASCMSPLERCWNRSLGRRPTSCRSLALSL